ncbi:MAG TPA: hypothetical protein VIK59_08710 [Verrucomicrobiae bacterium]
MNSIIYFFLTLLQWVERAGSLPHTVTKAFQRAIQEKQRQVILHKNEAERLDRICHPLKYRGK